MNELILEIMKLALEKNQTSKNTFFVRYYGHTKFFDFEFYKHGWGLESKADYSKIMISLEKDEKTIMEELNEILEFLKRLED